MRSRTILTKLVAIVVSTLTGAALEEFGAWFVWEWIYGIGSRVVSDELYLDLKDSVAVSGPSVGATSGLLFAMLLRPRDLPRAIGGQHIISIVAGSVGGGYGWRYGLAAYHSSHAACVVMATVVALAQTLGSASRQHAA